MTHSTLRTPIGWFTAFSGNGAGRNNPDSVGHAGSGALPLGSYYIVDRQRGTNPWNEIKAWYRGKWDWFGLYRDDGIIDDQSFIAGVRRHAFRLHPAGDEGGGFSLGCITLPYAAEFAKLRAWLLSQSTFQVGKAGLTAYGRLDVVALAPDPLGTKDIRKVPA